MLIETKKIEKQEVTVVSSLDVAETFEKRHDHVLRDIANITAPKSGLSEECIRSNFINSSYIDSTGRKLTCYYLTKDGFALLVMGYTGEKAMRFKEMYVKQFNTMAKLLQGKLIERENPNVTLTKSDILKKPYAERSKLAEENPEAYAAAMKD